MNRKLFPLLVLVLILIGTAPIAAQDYSDIDRNIRSHQIHHNNLKQIHQQLVLDLESDEEKVRAFYIWITDNISYDVPLYKSKWAKDRLARQPLKKRLQRTLKKRSAICGGYAELFRELCRLSNIEAEVVSGFPKTGEGHISKQKKPSHGWNKVKIDGQWKLLDTTWGSGYVTKNGKYIKHFKEHYFFTPPEKFYHNHFPAEVHNLRQTKGISLKQFFYFPIVHKAFFNSIDALGPNGIKGYHKAGVGKYITVYFEKSDTIWSLDIYDGKKFIKDFLFRVEGDTWSVSFKFDKPGIYYPILFIDGEPALTYKVKVNKIDLPIL